MISEIVPIHEEINGGLLYACNTSLGVGTYRVGKSNFEAESRDVVSTRSVTFITPTLNQFVALSISAVPEVEQVSTLLQGNALQVEIVVDAFDAEVRNRIYERQEAIIHEFEMFEFDFYIVSRRGRDLSECPVDSSFNLAFRR
jgi:hypothetical protein